MAAGHRTPSVFAALALALGLCASPAAAQIIFYEPFDYPAGPLFDSTTTSTWSLHSGVAPPLVLETPSDVGNSLDYPNILTASDDRLELYYERDGDIGRDIAPTFINSGDTIYVSMLLKIGSGANAPGSSAGGHYIAHFYDQRTPGRFRGRLQIRRDSFSDNIYLGVSWGTNDLPVWSFTAVAPNQTHCVVMKLVRQPGDDNDRVNLYVNPTMGALEPLIPQASTTNSSVNTNEDIGLWIGRFALRQASGIGRIQVDEIRLGRTWADVTPPLTPPASATGAWALYE